MNGRATATRSLLGTVIFALCAGSFAQGPKAGSQGKTIPAPPAGLSRDAYDVYSAVLQHPDLEAPSGPSPLLIANVTGETYGWEDPGNAIQAPAPYQAKFQEVLSDARKQARQELRIEARFRVKQGYNLLDAQSAKEFVDWVVQGGPRHSAEPPQFANARNLTRLSAVYFSQDHSLAIVVVSQWCERLCGNQRWRILEKRNGTWVELNWVTSHIIS